MTTIRYCLSRIMRPLFFVLVVTFALGVAPSYGQQPDLTVTNVSAPANPSAGSIIMVHYTISNIGTADAFSALFFDGIYMERDAAYHEGHPTVGFYIHGDTLHAGESKDDSAMVFLSTDSLGQFYFVVHTDDFNMISESNENNNAGYSGPVNISSNLPDFVVTNVTAPKAATSGGSIQISYTLKNQGNLDLPKTSWYDYLVLSKDTVYGNSDDVDLTLSVNDTSLSIGDSFTKTVNAYLGSITPGHYYVIVHTNYAELFVESDFNNNNGRSEDVGVDLRLPDLVISSITVEPKVTQGSFVHFSYTVKNIGDTAVTAASWSDEVFLLRDSVFSDSLPIAFPFHTVPLAAGDSLIVPDSAWLSPALTKGTYFIGVYTDPINMIHEASDSNNSSVSRSFQYVTKQPDLVISNLHLLGGVGSGGFLRFSYTVKNIGDTAVTAFSWRDEFRVSPDSTFPSYEVAGTYTHYEALAVNDSLIVTDSTTLFQIVQPGRYFLGVKTDDQNFIYETNENNNFAVSAPFQYSGRQPDLIAYNIQVPASIEADAFLHYSYMLKNIGDTAVTVPSWTDVIYLMIDSVFSESLYVGYTNRTEHIASGESLMVADSVLIPHSITRGKYFLGVKTDQSNSVLESNENNNTAISRSFQYASKVPDLAIYRLQVQPTLPAGAYLHFSYTVKNIGDTAVMLPDWYDGYYLMKDSVYASNIFLGQLKHPQKLATGDSLNITDSVRFEPTVLPGRYFLGVKVDLSDLEFESNENNNTAVSHSIQYASEGPDLVVTQVQLPTSAFSGGAIDVTWFVKNNGTYATTAPQWFDAIYLSPSPAWDSAGSTRMALVENVSYLPPGQSYSNTKSITLPDGITGNYYVFVVTDQTYKVAETSDGNNRTRSTDSVHVSLSPYPDLRVTALSVPANAFSGDSVTVSYTVTNMGTGVTRVSHWEDYVYFSQDTTLDVKKAKFMYLGGYSHVLQADSSYTVTMRLRLPYAVSGLSYFYVSTDVHNLVYEYTGETNNVLRSSVLDITLTPPPDLVMTHVSAPRLGTSGHFIHVAFTVQNQGATAPEEMSWQDRVYASRSSAFVLDSSIAMGAFRHWGSLMVDSSYTISDSVRLPDSLSGNYYIHVRTDWEDDVFENGVKSNNVAHADSTMDVTLSPWADLAVTSFTVPTGVAAGQTVRFTWRVQNNGPAAPLTPLWTDQIYLSPRASFDSIAIPIHSVIRRDTLAPLAYYDAAADVPMLQFPWDNVFFYVRTDADNVVYEHGSEANNIARSDTVHYQPAPDADLTVTSFTTPLSGQSSHDVQLSWTVTNVGVGPTIFTVWYDAVFLSPDTIYRPGQSIPVKSFPAWGNIGISQTYQKQFSVTLPDGVSGTYYLLLVVDSGAVLNESNRVNNVRASSMPITITLTPSPDLQITSFTPLTSLITGNQVTVRWTVENMVNVPTFDTSWIDGVYVSSDPILDMNDIRVGTTEHRGILPGNGSYSDSARIVVPSYAVGDLYLLIVTDSRKDIYEGQAGEANNIIVQPVSVTSALPSDLYITNIAAPAVIGAGDDAVVSWLLHNKGTNPANGYVTDAVYVSTDTVWDVHDPLLGIYEHQVSVPAGGSLAQKYRVNLSKASLADSAGNITAPFPGVPPGSYYVIVRTDLKNSIPETDKTNDVSAAASATDVAVPALTLGVSTNGKLAQGASKFYRVDSVAAGQALRVTLTSTNTGASHELFIKYGAVPSRGSFDAGYSNPFAPNQVVFVPDTRAGTYYVMLYGNQVPGDTSAYSIIADIVQFSITSVSPNHGGNTGEVTIAVSGARFVPGTAVSLVGPGGSTPRLIQSTYIGTSEIDATFDLAGGTPLGSYDVVVTRPDTTVATLHSGFTVEPGTAFSADLGFAPPASIVRGRSGFYSIDIENTSNVDLPYLVAYILIPGGTDFTVNTDRLTRFSQALPESLRAGLSVPDGFDVDGWTYIPLVAMHVRVGERLGIALQVNRVQGFEFPIQIFATAYSRKDFIANMLSAIELGRQEIVANPNPFFDPAFIQLAQIPADFTHAILNVFVSMGYLTQDDITSVTPADLARAVMDAGRLPKNFAQARFGASMSCKDQVNLAKFGYKVIKLGATIIGGLLLAPVTMGTSLIMTGVGIAGAAMAAHDLATGKSGFLVKLFCGKDPRTPTDIVASKDPNDLEGPGGYGDRKWVGVTQSLPYMIQFENDPKLATAPAQVVKVTLPLDSTVDERSFRLGRFGFGSFIFADALDRSYYTGRLNVRDSLGIDVDVIAGVDVQTRSAFWIFTSVDTLTGIVPTNPMRGFLPVNDSLHHGEGFVTFSFRAKNTVPTGSLVNEKARIIFDLNDPLNTPQATNTIDAGIPTSRVTAATMVHGTSDIDLRWHATDDSSGSGIATVSVFVSTDDSAFVPFVSGVTDTSGMFHGTVGHTYSFYALAIDNAGNVEPGKATPDIQVAVTGVQDLRSGVPREYELSQNYPNPFNPQTTIDYALPVRARVTLIIYNVLGQRVVTLLDNEQQDAGYKRASWNAASSASGMYFYRIQATGMAEGSKTFTQVKKMVLIK